MEDKVPPMEARSRKALTPFLYATRLLGLTLCALAPLVGCTTTGPLSSLAGVKSQAGPAVQLAVIAEPRTVEQNGQKIDGLVVQVILLDQAGRLGPADGGLMFSVYREDGRGSRKVEADHQWKFSAEDVAASQTKVPLGVLHNFWLPLKGKLAGAKKLELLTAYNTTGGLQLTQWNHVTSAPKSMSIEKTSDIVALKAKIDEAKKAAQATAAEESVSADEATEPAQEQHVSRKAATSVRRTK